MSDLVKGASDIDAGVDKLIEAADVNRYAKM